ncbi:MAG: DUF2095 family protein [Candidatus Hadarchaeota archaeon]
MAKKANEDFKKKYPNLANELECVKTVNIHSVRSSVEEAEKAANHVMADHFYEGYEPTAIDFIRRCKTKEQALEIISFLELKAEIKPEYAKQLRAQLTERGLDSFGKRKAPGCYERGEG